MDFLAKHWGDLASIIGLAITIWFAYTAKTAAEKAREAAERATARISALDTIGDLSTAITMLQEIVRLQRTDDWETIRDLVLERYIAVRSHLVRSEEGLSIDDFQRRSISRVNAQLAIIMEAIESASLRKQQDELDKPRLNRVISDQIGAIERVRVSLKTK